MAYAMTKQGSLDNCVTYEFICDTVEDMNAIENRYRTIGTVAIVLQGASGLEVYIAGSDKQWNSLSSVGDSGGTGAGLSIHICGQDEVSNGVPNVSEPDESTVYLVANNGDTGNLYDEFIYVNDAWEKWGSADIDLSGYAPIASPAFTGSISLNRKTGTTAGTESIAVGNETAANGPQTVAFGRSTISNGDVSFTCGSGLVATGGSEFVIGTYNKLPAAVWQPNTAYVMDDYVVYHDKLYYCASPHTSAATFEEDSGWYHARKYLLTIGNGNNSSGRGNAFVVDIWGDAHLEGDLYVGCDDDSQGGAKVATISQIPDVSTLAPKASPEFTGSISLGRLANTTVGSSSLAIGSNITASGMYSQAEGDQAVASGAVAHAEGSQTLASGNTAHAEGSMTTASEASSHAEGTHTTASGMNAHAEGSDSKATGMSSHAEGYGGTYTYNNVTYTSAASGLATHTEGYQCIATQGQPGNHAEGYQTQATGGAAHAEGNLTLASGVTSHSEGNTTVASGPNSHAEGLNTTASGNQSHAEGSGTIASKNCAHAEGANTHATGLNSHAEGDNTIASGSSSHTEGHYTIASRDYSHVAGMFNITDDYNIYPTWGANTAYAIGDKVKRSVTQNSVTTVYGYTCKTAHTSSSTFDSSKWNSLSEGAFVEIIGNGTSTNARSNARALDWSGNEYLNGDLYVGCASDSTGGVKLARIPDPPTTDGTYTLQATVSSGVITYSWVSAG